jgi:hypothetical protein
MASSNVTSPTTSFAVLVLVVEDLDTSVVDVVDGVVVVVVVVVASLVLMVQMALV